MNDLTVFNHNGVPVTDSREVAGMVEKRHSDLLETIQGYDRYLTNGIFRSLDFFIPSTYIDAKGEGRPCYLLTRKGCDMVANKMTGEKGVLFTAMYVTKFEEMEKQLRVPQTFAEALRLAADREEEKERIKAEKEQLLIESREKDKKLEFFRERQKLDGMMRASEIAQYYGLKAREFNRIMQEEKIIKRIDDNIVGREHYYVITAKYADTKYCQVITDTLTNGKKIKTNVWLPESLEFIDSIMERRGYKLGGSF
jgi:Rha family phage regulatory protein